MPEITRMSWLGIQIQSKNETENRTRANALILLGFIGGILSALFGFLLLGVHSLTGSGDRLENYGGVALLVAAFVCFGIGSHFMDKAEEDKRRYKKADSKNLRENNSVGIKEIQ